MNGAKTEPMYVSVKKYILNGIIESQFKPNEKLPSERMLTDMFKTSHITVRRAMSDLVNEGAVYRVKGKGSFVTQTRTDKRKIQIMQMLASNVSQDGSLVDIARGSGRYMTKRGIGIQGDYVTPGPVNENEYIRNLISERSRGAMLFLTEPENNVHMFKELDRAEIPYVLIDRFPYSYQVNSVTSNNIAGGYTQTAHLISMGHERIVFVLNRYTLNTEKERQLGYLECMAAKIPAIPPIVIWYDENFTNEVLRLYNDGLVTALAVVNDLTAMKIIQNLESAGLKFPHDLSIIGYDNWEPARFVKPALTTIRQDFELMGYQGAKLLYENMNDKSVRGKVVFVPVSLVERDSVARRQV